MKKRLSETTVILSVIIVVIVVAVVGYFSFERVLFSPSSTGVSLSKCFYGECNTDADCSPVVLKKEVSVMEPFGLNSLKKFVDEPLAKTPRLSPGSQMVCRGGCCAEVDGTGGCTETDSGRDYENFGVTTDTEERASEDTCYDYTPIGGSYVGDCNGGYPCELVEFSCIPGCTEDPTGNGCVLKERYDCPWVCGDGKCKNICEEPLPDYSTQISDPEGDVSNPAIDIVNMKIGSIGDNIQFVMELAQAPTTINDTHFIWFLDTDYDSSTGQPHGEIGSEYNVRVNYNQFTQMWVGSLDDITSFGERPSAHFIDDKRIIISVPSEAIEGNSFAFYFEASNMYGYDMGSIGEFTFSQNDWDFILETPNDIFPSRLTPQHMYVPTGDSAPLSIKAKKGIMTTEINPNWINYLWDLQGQIDVINSNVVDITENYSENLRFIAINSYIENCDVLTDIVRTEIIRVSLGDLYLGENVAFIIPGEFIPADEGNPDITATDTLDFIMNEYHVINLVDSDYSVQSELMGLPPRDNEPILYEFNYDLCGGAAPDVPIGLGYGCIESPDNEPDWRVFSHELGHVFAEHIFGNNQFIGFHQFEYSEAWASLNYVYSISEIVTNPSEYGVSEPELSSLLNRVNLDLADSRNNLINLENEGINFSEDFSVGLVHGIMVRLADEYGWDIYPRFYRMFLPEYSRRFETIEANQVETFFITALSVAAGDDLRPRFENWNFPINDTYFDELWPIMEGIMLEEYPLPELDFWIESQGGNMVTVNGVTGPYEGPEDEHVYRIFWNWGDGIIEDAWFPGGHVYGGSGQYPLVVTSFGDSGRTTKRIQINIS